MAATSLPAMRLRPALAALSATALLGLAACGGSSDDESSSASSSSTSAAGSSSAETSDTDDVQVQAFCADVEQVSTELSSQLETATPEQLPALLQQAVDSLDELDPPAEIADAVSTTQDTYQQLVDTVATLDLSTPEGQQAFSDAATQLGLGSTPAETEIDDWTTANCDASATPTS